MEERQIIYNLKGLKDIKPDSNWKQAAKARILDNSYPKKSFSWGFLPSWALKPAPIAISGSILVLAVVFVFIAITNNNPIQNYVAENLETLHGFENQAPEDPEIYLSKIEQMLALEDINIKEAVAMTKQAAEKLTALPAKNPEAMEKIVKSVNNINQKVKELEAAADTLEKAETLAELKEKTTLLTVQATQVLEENIESTAKELAKNLIQILESRTLSVENADLLQKAKEYYNNQEYQKSLQAIDFLLTGNAGTN